MSVNDTGFNISLEQGLMMGYRYTGRDREVKCEMQAKRVKSKEIKLGDRGGGARVWLQSCLAYIKPPERVKK